MHGLESTAHAVCSTSFQDQPVYSLCHNANDCCAGQLFASVVKQALQGLQQLSDFDNNPDMADDTFLLIGRGIRYSPGVVLNAQMLPLILQASMAGLLVQHRCVLHYMHAECCAHCSGALPDAAVSYARPTLSA